MRPSTSLTVTTALTLVLTAAAAAPGTGAGPDHDGSAGGVSTYRNPLSAEFADTFADPAVIRGKDGWWYAYGTTDPLREGEGTRHLVPTARSTDLVSWEYVGDAFSEDALPTWADTSRGAALWAPDVRYVDGQYRMYYVVTETTVTDEPNDNAIGVATAPTPTGPWTPTTEPVVGPRHGAGGAGDFLWTFDPSHVVGPGGTEHLFYGSYYGGIWTVPLSSDGTRAVGEPVQVAIDNKYEGAYVVQRDGWWYLFASSANCCAGPTTGYSVHVGRSRDLTGPYVDREGVPLLQSRAGGTPVVAPSGNRWVGTGHNAVVTDLAGQDWLAYHAIDRGDPYLDGTDGINERPMLLDRLDWVDGWPTVRGGAWASDDEQRAPVTEGRTATTFAEGLTRAWSTTGTWADADEPHAGRHLRSDGRATVVARSAVGKDARVEADVRVDAGVAASASLVLTARAGSLTATLDPATRTLAVERTQRGRTVDRASVPVPASADLTTWHAMALTVRGGVARAELTHARLGDPLATVALDVRHHAVPGARGGAVAAGAGVHVDNLSVLPAARSATRTVPVPRPGALLRELGDEFDGTTLDDGWRTVRDPQVTVADGVLTWPTEAADLVGSTNDAGVLLRDVPETDWVAETRLSTDLGTDAVRNFQQGGLIAYVDDDLWARLSHVAIWNTRQTEFGTERPYAGRLSYGGTIVGPPAETTWLRLVHRTDRTGEHDVQAFTSTDGRTWVAGGVWTFPAGSDLHVGLVSHGGAGATSQFDYLRVSRLARG